METSLVDFLSSSPHKNGFLSFVVGILFVLTIYHFMLYFQHKNKTYIFYSTYTFLIFITYFSFTQNDFLEGFTTSIKPFFKLTHLAWVWIYNIIYFFFVFNFLNFTTYYPKSTKIIKKILFILLSIAFILLITSFTTNSLTLLTAAYTFVFLPVIISLSFYSFYLVYISPEPAKIYIFIGDIIFSISILIFSVVIFYFLIESCDRTELQFKSRLTIFCVILGLLFLSILLFFDNIIIHKNRQVY